MLKREVPKGLLYLLFALSGLCGLIYESIWAHYLKLFLGHAAYAQTLVLAIFMGGMALGAWGIAVRARHWRRPLLAYAVVEALLGLSALVFDPMFRFAQMWALDSAIPALPGPVSIDLLKWGLSTVLILPQCVLLGATFPLMSSALVRRDAAASGRVLAWLYFSNSLGASIGVLLSGLALVAWVGLPGTIMTAGLLNLLIVAVLWVFLRSGEPEAVAVVPAGPAVAAAPGVLLAAALLTGAASFMYEIGWVRMLSLVLGSATHSFEFMLSAFILGLALGSFWIRRRIDTAQNPLRMLGWIQIAMALAALGSLLVYRQSFSWMAAFLGNVQATDGGYMMFNLVSHGICLALMLPVTFCAGMTLPLITACLMRAGFGEAAIGRVYAVNTVGAIAGVLVAVHLIMPVLGLRQVIVIGAAIDLALGVWLLLRASVPRAERMLMGSALVLAAVVVLSVRFDPRLLASGVYRYGLAELDREVLFHRDGKTASIDVLQSTSGTQISIATNGKVDAMMSIQDPSPDDYTMTLLGALPAVLHPAPRRAAIIGLGSGRSSHVLLGDPRLERVDTLEIEPAMAEGARFFGAPVARAFEDPRSRILFEDAKTFFARERARYDLIISEPSNPWVSGVASLFSSEFYQTARRHLAPGGVFTQWVQMYDIDPGLIATILRALGEHFTDWQIYGSYDGDMLVIATADGAVPLPSEESLAAVGATVREELAKVEFRSAADLLASRIGGRRELEPLLRSLGQPANSDFFPVLDQQAVRHRFLQSRATGLLGLQPWLRRLESHPVEPLPSHTTTLEPRTRRVQAHVAAAYLRWRSTGGEVPLSVPGALFELLALETLRGPCGMPAVQEVWLPGLRDLLERLGPYFSRNQLRDLARDLSGRACHGSAPAEYREWVAFTAAVGAGELAAIRRHGTTLLRAIPDDEPLPHWVVHEMLAAELQAAELGNFGRMLAWFGPRLPDTLPVRLLQAHAAHTD